MRNLPTMRILAALLLTASLHVHAKECGLFQAEDFRERIIYSLTDFFTARPMNVVMHISNPEKAASMITNNCYCVDGTLSPDPDYEGDPMYKILEITRIVEGPTQDCGPMMF